MYYELGTMVAISNNATPFANHEKGISIPSIDVVGEIISIHPATLSYVVRLSKKFTLTFSEDDIYRLPSWMSDKRYMFHRMLGSNAADVHPFYYVGEFESYITRAEEKQLTMYYPNYNFDPKFIEKRSVDSSLKALEELNRREAERIAAEPIKFNINIDEFKLPTKEEINAMFGISYVTAMFEYKKIIFNGPCTIILWKDGTKTIAKTSGEDVFDPEKGVAICFMKKIFGHTETNKILRKASEQYEEYIAENRPNGSFEEFIDFCKGYFKSDTKPVDHIDQSTIDEVKKVEEDQQDERK